MTFCRWFEQYPETLMQYESRNRQRWALEKRFEVENGFRFVSQLMDHERRRPFCLSRVGFSANGQFAVVFIRYAVACSYYVVFERSSTRWSERTSAWLGSREGGRAQPAAAADR